MFNRTSIENRKSTFKKQTTLPEEELKIEPDLVKTVSSIDASLSR